MRFIKISLNENLEQLINVDNIEQVIKGEDYKGIEFVPSFTLILKNCGPIKISENVYKQITEKLKELIL